LSSGITHSCYMSEIINYTVRVERELKDAMKADAETHSRSLNAHFVKILEQYLAGELVPVDELLNDPRSRNLIKAIIQSATETTEDDIAKRFMEFADSDALEQLVKEMENK